MTYVLERESEGIKILARTTPDKVKLFVDVEKTDQNARATRKMLLDSLRDCININNVNISVLDNIVSHLHRGDKTVLNRRVSMGKAPKNGKNGELTLKVKKLNLDSISQPTIASDSDKLTDVHVFDNIKRGDVIGRITYPTPGEEGIDVFGEIINPIPGAPVLINIDNSILRKRSGIGDFDILIALETGCLTEKNGVLSITKSLHVNSDVDFHWGNINFIGEVKISGDVMPGFNIKAQKGIEIRGSVRGGSLISTEGAVQVRDYVFGGEGSMILAGKFFSASVVQQVNTEIIGDIFIHKEASNSILRTAGALIMPDGVLVGGEVLAVRGVEARIIGSEAGTKTVIKIVNSVEASLEYSRLLVQAELCEKKIKHMRLKLGPHADNPGLISSLDEYQQRRIMPLFLEWQEECTKKRAIIEMQYGMLALAKMRNVVRVNFLDKVYEGVVIQCGAYKYDFKREVKGPGSIEFNLKTKKFSFGPVRALQ